MLDSIEELNPSIAVTLVLKEPLSETRLAMSVAILADVAVKDPDISLAI
jgi:hypothetical protein